MDLKFVEAVSTQGNWGKFAIGRHTFEEWQYKTRIPEVQHQSLIRGRGWGVEHSWVLDMQTGEGAIFRLGGFAKADLNKRKIWVCPLYEPFLTWLYKHHNSCGETWWHDLPELIELDGVPLELCGYRRPGPE